MRRDKHALMTHGFGHAGNFFVDDFKCSVRCEIAGADAGTAGGDDESAVGFVGHAAEFGFDARTLVGDDFVVGLEGGRQILLECPELGAQARMPDQK